MSTVNFTDAAKDLREERGSISYKPFQDGSDWCSMTAVTRITFDPCSEEVLLTHGNITGPMPDASLEKVLRKFEEEGISLIPSLEVPARAMDNKPDGLHYFLNPKKYVLHDEKRAPNGFCLQERMYPTFRYYPVENDIETPVSLAELRNKYLIDEDESLESSVVASLSQS